MSKGGSYDHLGFVLASTPRSGTDTLHTVARFRCMECGKEAEQSVASGRPLDPEGLAKKMKARGWEAFPFRRSGTACPACASPAKTKNDTDSELRKVIPMAAQPAPVIVREITSEQRFEIRALLDKHFDDKAGMFLDGMTDQVIAEKVNVPRVRVEQMRETAYGPIRIDPATAQMLADIGMLQKEVDGQQKALDQIKAKLDVLNTKAGKVGKAA